MKPTILVRGCRLLVGLAITASVWSDGAIGAALRVRPIRLNFDSSHSLANIVLTNEGDEKLEIAVRSMAWSQVEGSDNLVPTSELIVKPVAESIPAHSSTTIAVGYAGEHSLREKAFRVIFDEVASSNASLGAVGMALSVTIPAFVDTYIESPSLAWRMTTKPLALFVKNNGNSHVQITEVTLQGEKGKKLASQRMSLYLLPGSERSVDILFDASMLLTKGAAITGKSDVGTVPKTILNRSVRGN